MVVVSRTMERYERAAPWLLSALLHILLIVALAAALTNEANLPPTQETSVDVLSPEQFNAIVDAAKTPDHAAEKPAENNPAQQAPADFGVLLAPPLPGPDPAPRESARTWRQATQILSEAALADPRHKKMAAKLDLLEANTRLEQLCNLEAILQIGERETQFQPETVIAYAMKATRSDDDLIIADGAAFWSHGKWYNLAFKCRISPRQKKVSAFEFATGDSIPERDWAAHDLPRQQTAGGDD
ncbi:DUF930 domain-containing protein [Methylocapsa sp. S129]|uniref:DUF930 domain-containing protein n=1 Tax=Methylocapsa sp. S129 TaxID=1641869 RepID=UPI00131C6997|nr:DUF930 domain-containing protein [Methylocapsa sp. S129]